MTHEEPNKRVMIVEDNENSAESMAMLLEFKGHNVSTVSDGLAALKLATTFRPDVVILDISLPDMDGYEVAQRLRSDPASTMVLVALSGYGSAEHKRKASEAGFNHHFVKPVDFDALLEVLR